MSAIFFDKALASFEIKNSLRKHSNTYMNLIVQLSLEAVRALRDSSIQVIGFVDCQVVWADWGHGKATDTAYSSCQMNALAVVVLNLMMMKVPRFCHNIIMPSSDATISSKWFRMTHVLASCDVLLGGLGGLWSAATPTLLRQQRVRHSCHYFTTHY